MKVKITQHDREFAHKPTPDDIRVIQRQLKEKTLSIYDLADNVAAGRTFQCGLHSEKYSKTENWIGQQVFVVDFDNKSDCNRIVSFAEALEHSKSMQIPPAFAYFTFSHTEDVPRFRFVWYVTEVIHSLTIHYAITQSLIKVFSDFNIDVVITTKLKTLVFGTHEDSVIHSHYMPTRPDAFIQAAVMLEADAENRHGTRNRERLANELGVLITERGGLAAYTIEPLSSIDSAAAGLQVRSMSEPDDENLHIWEMLNEDGSRTRIHTARVVKRAEYNRNGVLTKRARYDAKGGERINVPFELLINVDKDELIESDPLLRAHLSGEYIPHNLRWILTTNLAFIEGGKKLFWEGVEKRWEIEQRDDPTWLKRWADVWETCGNAKQYNPTNYTNPNYKDEMDKYFPHITDQLGAISLYSLAYRSRFNRVELIAKNDLKPVGVVTRMVEELTDKILAERKPGVYVIRADTGVGKSTIIRSRNIDAVVAAPRHDLIKEYVEAYHKIGRLSVKATPALPDVGETMQSIIDGYYAIGAGDSARRALQNLKTTAEVAKYFDELSDTLSYKGTIVTTHARLPYLNTEHDVVFVDEDIIGALTPTSSVELDSLALLIELMRDFVQGKRGFTDKIDINPRFKLPSVHEIKEDIRQLEGFRKVLDDRPENMLDEIPRLMLNSPDFVEYLVISHKVKNPDAFHGNLLGLLRGSFFLRRVERETGRSVINFGTRFSLPANKTYIIFSATIDREIARMFFGNDLVEYYNTPSVELKQPLLVHLINTSRAALRNTKILNAAMFLVGDMNTITFKDKMDLFDKAVGYYGATSGLNHLAGQDLALLGTPHFTPDVYMLKTALMGYRVNYNDLLFGPQRIEIDGMSTMFPAYYNKTIQHIQLQLIRTELMQAIGRARAVHHNVKIVVLTNFPLAQAEYKYYTRAEIVALAEKHKQRKSVQFVSVEV